jgi:hypothetical protein
MSPPHTSQVSKLQQRGLVSPVFTGGDEDYATAVAFVVRDRMRELTTISSQTFHNQLFDVPAVDDDVWLVEIPP